MATEAATPTAGKNAQGKGPSGKTGDGILAFLSRRTDIAFALGVIGIIFALILPMPPWLLDTLLAASIMWAVLILMTVLFIEKPLEMSSFPTILLVTTMLRLSLNLASTRLILANGHRGTSAGGHVIEAFGNFIMSGNFAIGAIVFIILVIVNFIVITKGSGRIAEVSARFTLDALPGKQMAIDADLSSGLITEDEARARRKELQDENSFYGAMDGASKFVRGDAIAGILITVVNIVAGLAIGTLQQDITLSRALETYTLLTVGDGLVSQFPALIISTASGMLVTKSAISGSSDKALIAQLGNYPNALGLSSLLMVGMALLPGTPKIPFLTLAIITGGLAFLISQRKMQEKEEVERDKAVQKEQAQVQAKKTEETPVKDVLRIDQIRLELGYGLRSLADSNKGGKLLEQIKALRRQLIETIGFVMPSARLQDNLQLPAHTYIIRVKEIEAGRGDLRPGMLLIMDPRGEPISLPGEPTREPTFGLPAMWINEDVQEEAIFRGYTVVTPASIVTTHLTEVIKDSMAELLTYGATQNLLDELDGSYKKLVTDMIPAQITVSGVQKILQLLLAERVSIRDLPTILEGISEACGYTKDITMITEHVRNRLSRQISEANTNESGFIPLITLSPNWEKEFADAIVGEGDDKQLNMSPSLLQKFINNLRQAFEKQSAVGESPVLLTSPQIRHYVRSIVERFRPQTIVMSQIEIHPKAKIKTLGQV